MNLFNKNVFNCDVFNTGEIVAPPVHIVRSEKGGGKQKLKKYKMHPAPEIPLYMERRIVELEKEARKEDADHTAIIRELEAITTQIQEAIELSSSAIAVYADTPAPEAIAVEKRIGPHSLTARVATEKARQKAFEHARRVEQRAAHAAAIAAEEEMTLVAHAIGMVAMMED